MDNDLAIQIKALQTQKIILESYIGKSVDNMIAARIKTLESEGVDINNEKLKPIIDATLDNFRKNTLKALLEKETRDIDLKIKEYTKFL